MPYVLWAHVAVYTKRPEGLPLKVKTGADRPPNCRSSRSKSTRFCVSQVHWGGVGSHGRRGGRNQNEEHEGCHNVYYEIDYLCLVVNWFETANDNCSALLA